METDLLPFEMLMCLELLSCSRFTFFVVVVVVIARFFFLRLFHCLLHEHVLFRFRTLFHVAYYVSKIDMLEPIK